MTPRSMRGLWQKSAATGVVIDEVRSGSRQASPGGRGRVDDRPIVGRVKTALRVVINWFIEY